MSAATNAQVTTPPAVSPTTYHALGLVVGLVGVVRRHWSSLVLLTVAYLVGHLRSERCTSSDAVTSALADAVASMRGIVNATQAASATLLRAEWNLVYWQDLAFCCTFMGLGVVVGYLVHGNGALNGEIKAVDVALRVREGRDRELLEMVRRSLSPAPAAPAPRTTM